MWQRRECDRLFGWAPGVGGNLVIEKGNAAVI